MQSALLKYRQRLHKSQVDVCASLGVHPSTYSLWENGHRYPRRDFLDKLVVLFGVPASTLFPDLACMPDHTNTYATVACATQPHSANGDQHP